MNMLSKIHPDAAEILICRGLLTQNVEMEKNIGRKVKFIPAPGQGTIHRRTFKIIGVQKDYRGVDVYRVQVLRPQGGAEEFGFPATTEQLTFI